MTTFLQLTERTARRINGANIGRPAQRWALNTVKEWLRDAIRDFSDHFPRTVETAVAVVAEQREYDLPAGTQSVLTVEHPADCFLTPSRKSTPGPSEYLVITLDDNATTNRLLLGADPDPDEDILITATADHNPHLIDTDDVTVPDRHHNILVAFCIWQAWQSIRDNPPNHPTMVGSQQEAIDSGLSGEASARLTYYTLISQAKRNKEGQSAIIEWGENRIY